MGAGGSRGKRILLIEPEEAIAQDLRRRLECLGYDMAGIARSAEAAAGLDASLPFDLVICEVALDGEADGIGLARNLAVARGIPFILLCDKPEAALIEEMVKARPAAILTKPFKERTFFADIRLALASEDRRFRPSCGLLPTGEGILLIEDERIICLDIKRRLERFGYKVLGDACCAEEGIAMALALRPALIMTGISLGAGKMNGIDGIRVINRHFDVPVIYVTAMSDEGTIERAASTYPEVYITKPFKELELLISVRLALAKARDRKPAPDPTGLFAAALHGGSEEVAALLEGLKDVDLRDPRGKTPLMYAAQHSQDPAVLRLFLEAGADPGAVDEWGLTPLMHAAQGRSAGMAEVLLEAGAAPLARDKDGRSALDMEVDGLARPEILAAFLLAGVGAELVDGEGQSLSARILGRRGHIRSDNLVADLRLLAEAGATLDLGSVESIDAWLIAALAEAAPAQLRVLAGQGLGLGRRDDEGMTAIHHAASSFSAESLRFLIDAGCDLRARDNKGLSPLLRAVQGRGAIVDKARILLTAGASVEDRDAEGNTALLIACEVFNGPLAAVLLSFGADPDGANAAGQTPLGLFWQAALGDRFRTWTDDQNAFCGRTGLGDRFRYRTEDSGIEGMAATIRSLIEAGATIDLEGLGRPSPDCVLAFAAAGPLPLSRLIKSGADINAPDAKGRRALHVAAAEGCAVAIGTLLDLGADPLATANGGRLPIEYANEALSGSAALERLKAASQQA